MITCNKCLTEFWKVSIKTFTIRIPVKGWAVAATGEQAVRPVKINMCKDCLAKLNEDKK